MLPPCTVSPAVKFHPSFHVSTVACTADYSVLAADTKCVILEDSSMFQNMHHCPGGRVLRTLLEKTPIFAKKIGMSEKSLGPPALPPRDAAVRGACPKLSSYDTVMGQKLALTLCVERLTIALSTRSTNSSINLLFPRL